MKIKTAPLQSFSEHAPSFNYCISMDTKGPITPSSQNKTCIHDIVDAFSHFVVTVPNKSNNAKTAVKTLLHHWIVKFGPPIYLVTDRGTMRRKFDMNAQRQIWVPSRPNKRSRQEIADIDGELLTRANRFGGDYQPLEERIEEEKEAPQLDIADETEQESGGESQVIRGDNFPIVDLKAYNTEGKEAQFIQINQVIEKVTGNQKNTEETIKKAEFNFMLDLKTLIAKSSTDADLNRVRDALRRGEKNTAPEHY